MFQHLMLTEMEEKALDDYFKLDLDEEMMRKDIRELGFTATDY